MKHFEDDKQHSGKRIKRGLFKSSVGVLINADINEAIGIKRKVVGDVFLKERPVDSRGLA